MLYCGKPPKEKYKKTGENIKKHDLFFLSIFICFYLFFFRRQRRNFLYRTHVKIGRTSQPCLLLLFYQKFYQSNLFHYLAWEVLNNLKIDIVDVGLPTSSTSTHRHRRHRFGGCGRGSTQVLKERKRRKGSWRN